MLKWEKSTHTKVYFENSIDSALVAFKLFDIETVPTNEQLENKQKIQEQILHLIKLNPKISRTEISISIGTLSPGGVDYHLGKLKKEGLIKREGGAKGGAWVILETLF